MSLVLFLFSTETTCADTIQKPLCSFGTQFDLGFTLTREPQDIFKISTYWQSTKQPIAIMGGIQEADLPSVFRSLLQSTKTDLNLTPLQAEFFEGLAMMHLTTCRSWVPLNLIASFPAKPTGQRYLQEVLYGMRFFLSQNDDLSFNIGYKNIEDEEHTVFFAKEKSISELSRIVDDLSQLLLKPGTVETKERLEMKPVQDLYKRLAERMGVHLEIE